MVDQEIDQHQRDRRPAGGPVRRRYGLPGCWHSRQRRRLLHDSWRRAPAAWPARSCRSGSGLALAVWPFCWPPILVQAAGQIGAALDRRIWLAISSAVCCDCCSMVALGGDAGGGRLRRLGQRPLIGQLALCRQQGAGSGGFQQGDDVGALDVGGHAAEILLSGGSLLQVLGIQAERIVGRDLAAWSGRSRCRPWPAAIAIERGGIAAGLQADCGSASDHSAILSR